MSLQNPRVTVLMPVYNGEKYLRQAIDSILTQTFKDFEFLIINDGSKDGSVKIIDSYEDHRIRLVHNEKNLKLIATLNKGFDLARGDYLARMDCDDISLPTRLEKQIKFMDLYPEVGVCGTWAKEIDESGKPLRNFCSPIGDSMAKYIWRPTPVIHPTAFFRKLIYQNFKYDAEYPHAEDLELWQRIYKVARLDNLKENLLMYRVHPTSVTGGNRAVQLNSVYKAFVKVYGAKDISFQEFLTILYESNSLNPYRRAWVYSKIASKFKTGLLDVLVSNFKYLVYWLYPEIKKKR